METSFWFMIAMGLVNWVLCGWYIWMIVRTRRLAAKAHYVVTRMPRLLATMRTNELALCAHNRMIKNDTVADQHWIRADMLTTLIEMIDAAYDAVDSKQAAQRPPTKPEDASRTTSLH